MICQLPILISIWSPCWDGNWDAPHLCTGRAAFFRSSLFLSGIDSLAGPGKDGLVVPIRFGNGVNPILHFIFVITSRVYFWELCVSAIKHGLPPIAIPPPRHDVGREADLFWSRCVVDIPGMVSLSTRELIKFSNFNFFI